MMKTSARFLGLGLGLCLLFEVNQAFPQPNFTPYENNPVIAYGPAGSWDAGVIYLPEVVFKDSLYYMFYSGSANLMTTPFAMGYATSTDGFTWSKYNGNPVFQADGSGFDAFSAAEPCILLEDNLWVMYYSARSVPGPGPGPAIGRATAPEPAGPWTRLEDPVLTVGSAGEWDAHFVTPNTIIATDTGFVMYYSGGTGFPFPPTNDHARVGMATSADGINWVKYDDPATTDPPFAESDPVLQLGAPGSYDSGLAWECDVLPTENGWEMFYTSDPDDFSGERLCYATSSDGIHWTKDANNPFLSPTQPWATLDLVAPSVIKIDGTYFMYYLGTTTLLNGQIGLATGQSVTNVATWRNETPRAFELMQNYPNPFNPTTTISFQVQAQTSVTLSIFNVLGQQTRTLLEQTFAPGVHTVSWDGLDDNGQAVPSGLYVYQLRSGRAVISKKMILIR
ncbi:MAG: T9SS type A sorting domain-containing protein [bacterium]